MQDVTRFEPRWNIYLALFSAFLLAGLCYHLLIGLTSTAVLFLSVLAIVLFGYLLSIQNRLELSADKIRHSYLLPFHPTQTVERQTIDWIALDNRPLAWAGLTLMRRSCVVMKLKDNRVINVNLFLLKGKTALESFFLELSNQLTDHDKELFKLKDLQGFSQLAIDATLGLTDLVEAMHDNIARIPGLPMPDQHKRTGLASTLIYKNIKTITALAGSGIDGILAQISPLLKQSRSTETDSATGQAKQVSLERAALLSALNGVLGDYLVTTNNAMAIPMRFRRHGHSLTLNSAALKDAIQPMTGKLLVLVHGLCMNDLQWLRKGHDHGAALTRDLGYSCVYLRYNSGQHISANGRAFAALLEVLVKLWPTPLEDMVIIGHSMGGLVSRSAVHYAERAGDQWLGKLRKMIFLGSPHHGAPLERGGNWIDTLLDSTPYTAPLARLGKIRSAGITDLRYGNIIDEHWQGRDRFERSQDSRLPVPLPGKVQCFTVAGTTGNKVGDVKDQLLGDGLVQVNSALGKHKDPNLCLAIPPERQWIGYGINHMDLLNHPDVYARINQWLL
jgi:pimeloyl-ACP methyl ester carboxylesterase